MNKIAVVTGTRAEYGLLQPLINKIHKDTTLELCLIVTGMHLSPEFGLTYKQIEVDGYPIAEKIEMLLSSDTSIGVTKSMGLGLISIAEVNDRTQPELVILLGDRYETFVAATAATIANIPIAHLHGGELTEGAFDEAFRHSITKMSYLHFTSTEVYRKRVIQLGEEPERVHNVGALGVENIKSMTLLSKESLEQAIKFSIEPKMAMITFHPVTLEKQSAERQFKELLLALDKFPDVKLIFTKANADTEGRQINKLIDEYIERYPKRAIAFTSMGQLRYLSALKYCDFVVGNSSSGIIEAPSFHIPTINIGNRQRGRVCSRTVINCESQREAIKDAITYALGEECKGKMLEYNNPYEQSGTSDNILKVVKVFLSNKPKGLKKHFYDYN